MEPTVTTARGGVVQSIDDGVRLPGFKGYVTSGKLLDLCAKWGRCQFCLIQVHGTISGGVGPVSVAVAIGVFPTTLEEVVLPPPPTVAMLRHREVK